jgi:hypothetical protein
MTEIEKAFRSIISAMGGKKEMMEYLWLIVGCGPSLSSQLSLREGLVYSPSFPRERA